MLDEILVRGTVYDGDEKTLLTSSRFKQEKHRRNKLTLKSQQKYSKYQSLENLTVRVRSTRQKTKGAFWERVAMLVPIGQYFLFFRDTLGLKCDPKHI